MISRRFLLFIVAITVLGAVLRFWGVGLQPLLSDEVQVVFTAEHYMQGGQFGPTMPYHPNMRNVVTYVSINLFGAGVLGIRGPSLLLGALCVPLLMFFTFRVTRDEMAALLAGLFMATDPAQVMFSRQAIQTVQTVFFFLSGVSLAHISLEHMDSSDSDTSCLKSYGFSALGAVFFGFSIASKSHGLFPWAVTCLLFAVVMVRNETRRPEGFIHLALISIIPWIVFLWTYLPWFGRGYSFTEWLFMMKSILSGMVAHAGFPNDSMIDITPAFWFVKPFMGYGTFTFSNGSSYVSIAMGNPLVWLLVLPACVYVAFKCKDKLLLVLFIVSYAPLAVASRPIWLISAIAVTPFAFGVVAQMLSALFRRMKGLQERTARAVAALYLVCVLVASLLLYPLSIGKGLDYKFLSPLVERLNPHTNELLKGP